MSENPPIEFAFPELRKWEKGAAPYIHVFESGKSGPTVMVAALTHGNEVSGAVVVDTLLEKGLRPRTGTLIFSFNNIEAYELRTSRTPFKSRMVDEDFNRTWGRLDQPATTVETRRAQVVKPFVERADLLLDLHSDARRWCAVDAGRTVGARAWPWPGKSARRSTSSPMPATPPACACATMAASAIPKVRRTPC